MSQIRTHQLRLKVIFTFNMNWKRVERVRTFCFNLILISYSSRFFTISPFYFSILCVFPVFPLFFAFLWFYSLHILFLIFSDWDRPSFSSQFTRLTFSFLFISFFSSFFLLFSSLSTLSFYRRLFWFRLEISNFDF